MTSKNNYKAWIYLAPSLILLIVFALYPLIDTFIISFLKDYNYINGKNNGEKGLGQQEHRKNGSHDEAHLAPARLDLPRASAARSGGSFAGAMLHFPFYFFGALLQLITQAFLLVLAFAHNGAPSFLSDVCIPCRNRLNTTKNPF